jgi:hypothetical protein
MSRDAKILIFGLILAFSVYNKYVNGELIGNYIDNYSSEKTKKIPKKTNPKRTVEIPNKNNPAKKEPLDKELEGIIQRMIDADETQKTINLVIAEYERRRNEKGIHSDLDNDKTSKLNVGKGYFSVSAKDKKEFYNRFPDAVNFDYSDDVGDFEVYSEIKDFLIENNRFKNGRFEGINEKVILKTRLNTQRSYNYNLFRDKRGVTGKIIEVYNHEDPKVYLLNRGAKFSKVILEYNIKDVKHFYLGFFNTGSIELKNNNSPTKEKNQYNDGVPKFNIDDNDYAQIPSSGFSPYDNYFGKGIYHQTDNSIVVTAPLKTHVVFVVVDTHTKKRIRNEFIRKGEIFTMTKIPYGTYDYMYFTGRNWSNNVLINKGTVKGGFQDYKSFNKNDYNEDQMEFKRGYYGSYQITLSQTIDGNLETKSTSESAFFN